MCRVRVQEASHETTSARHRFGQDGFSPGGAGLDRQGGNPQEVFARQLLASTVNLQVELIGMESCSGSHFLGRALREQGHEVRLMPAQYVKPYVQTNKSDFLDAVAIAEAVQRPRMRFVPIKTEEQLDLQALHRVRERWVMRRTAVVNQIRSLLLERGLTLPKGRSYVDRQLLIPSGKRSYRNVWSAAALQAKNEG